MTALVTNTPQILPETISELCTPQKYPEITGITKIIPDDNLPPQKYRNVVTFFKLYLACTQVYYKSAEYEKTKAKGEDDFVINDFDEIEVDKKPGEPYLNGLADRLSYSKHKWFLKINLLTLNGFSKAEWYHRISFRKEKTIDIKEKRRTDTLMNIHLRFTVPELKGRFTCKIIDAQEFDRSPTESFTYIVTNFDFEMEITIKEIDKEHRQENSKYRAPDIRFQYNFKDIVVTESSKPQSEANKNLLNPVLLNFVEQKLKLARTEIAERMARALFIKVTPDIVKKCNSEVDIYNVFRGAIFKERSKVVYSKDDTESVERKIESYGAKFSSNFGEKRVFLTGEFLKFYFNLPFFDGMYLPWNESVPQSVCPKFLSIFEK